MIVTHKIKMDLSRNRTLMPALDMVQTDTYCRKVEITVAAGGQAVVFPDDVTVRGSYRKADGTRGIYDTMPDGQTAAGSVAGNVVTLSLAPQLLTAAGTAELAVQLISGETLLNVFPIQVNVAPLPGFGGKSENYYSVSGLPQITAADNGKVLTVVDGMWVAGEAVTGSGGTVTAIDFTNFDSGSYTEVVNGKEVTHSVTFDDSGRPATVDGVTLEWPEEEEEASPVGVTLPVVELSTTFKMGASFTEEESKTLSAAFEKNTPVVIKCNVDVDEIGVLENTAFVWSPLTTGSMNIFVTSSGSLMLQIYALTGTENWGCNAQ